MDVGLENGTITKPLGMVRDIKINIEGFEFEIDVIVSNDNEGQDCPLFLGRSFMATSKSIVDLKLKEVFIRFNVYYQCYKVTPPPEVYNLAREVADD